MAKHVVQGHKGRCHAATGAQKLPPIQPQFGAMLVRQLLDAGFDVLLLRGLRQRIEFLIGNDLCRNWRGKGIFCQFKLRELSGAEIQTHEHPSRYAHEWR